MAFCALGLYPSQALNVVFFSSIDCVGVTFPSAPMENMRRLGPALPHFLLRLRSGRMVAATADGGLRGRVSQFTDARLARDTGNVGPQPAK